MVLKLTLRKYRITFYQLKTHFTMIHTPQSFSLCVPGDLVENNHFLSHKETKPQSFSLCVPGGLVENNHFLSHKDIEPTKLFSLCSWWLGEKQPFLIPQRNKAHKAFLFVFLVTWWENNHFLSHKETKPTKLFSLWSWLPGGKTTVSYSIKKQSHKAFLFVFLVT